jgi:hypothetical protein
VEGLLGAIVRLTPSLLGSWQGKETLKRWLVAIEMGARRGVAMPPGTVEVLVELAETCDGGLSAQAAALADALAEVM